MTPESLIKTQIRTYLQKTGWYVRSIASNQFTRAGNPDYFIIKNGVTIFIEVKSNTGKQTPAQIETGLNIQLHGGNYVVARSVDDIIDYLNR